jgi:hypothetical protein
MWNCVRVIGLAFVLMSGIVVAGQNRPNFSGRWVQVSPSEGAGTEQTRLTQTAAEVMTSRCGPLTAPASWSSPSLAR